MLTRCLFLMLGCVVAAGAFGEEGGGAQPPSAQAAPAGDEVPVDGSVPSAAGDGDADAVPTSPSAQVESLDVLPLPQPPAEPVTVPRDQAALAEVIVTATKRSTSSQNVPAAITVVDGEQIKDLNITDAAGLTKAAPSLTAISNSAGAFLQIRGIGSLSFSRTSEQSVGIVVDGVALANASLGSPALFDIAQVEVLEGPQGTLYGRNSSAGIVNITTVEPDPSGTTFAVHSDIGSRNGAIVDGSVNLPLSGYSALRVSAGYSKTPHTIYNAYQENWDSAATYNYRGRYLWQVADGVKLNLIADYAKYKLSGGGPWAVFQATPGSALSNDLARCGVTPSAHNSTACIDGSNYATSQAYGYSGELDYELGWATLSSISAYRRFLSDGNSDSDSIQENLLNTNAGTNDIRNLSQEFRLNSQNDGFFQYVFGLYYFDSKLFDTGAQAGKLIQLLPPPLDALDPLVLGQSFATSGRSKSYAVYEEATLNFLSSLKGIIGLRYGHEDVSADTSRAVAKGAAAPFASLKPIGAKTTDDYFSYKFGLQYDLAPKVMSYLTYSKGYKGPAINDAAADDSAPLVVKPEVPLAWELGLKSRLFDNRLQANIALYSVRYRNFQSQFYDQSQRTFVYGNAPAVTTKGIELSLLGLLTPNWTVNFGALYNDATYGKGYLVQCAQGQTAAQGCESEIDGTTATDAGGNRLVGSPVWKLNLQSEYSHDVNAGLQAFMSGDAVYTSRIYFNQAYDPIDTAGPHLMLGLRTGIRSRESHWSVSLYVRNLLDQRVPTYRLGNPLGYPFERDKASYVQIFGAESFRTFGVSFDGQFY